MEWLSIIVYNLAIVLKIMIKKQSDNQFVMTNFTFYVSFILMIGKVVVIKLKSQT